MNQKYLKFVVVLGSGAFGNSSNNTITMSGFQSSAYIDKTGGAQMGQLNARIFGVSLSDINAMTTLQWKPDEFIQNTVTVYAVDGSQETLIFEGNIVNAYGNFSNMPDSSLDIYAQSAYKAQMTPALPTSFNGAADVPTIARQMAGQMGYTFENNGVTGTILNPYFAGTMIDQFNKLKEAGGFDSVIDNGVLAIMPKHQGRNTTVPTVTASSGLVGYPTFDGVGISFVTEFNPAIVFGGKCTLVSQLKQACATMVVTSVGLQLDSMAPGGKWFQNVRMNPDGLAVQ